jgi:hypothetical protein
MKGWLALQKISTSRDSKPIVINAYPTSTRAFALPIYRILRTSFSDWFTTGNHQAELFKINLLMLVLYLPYVRG